MAAITNSRQVYLDKGDNLYCAECAREFEGMCEHWPCYDHQSAAEYAEQECAPVNIECSHCHKTLATAVPDVMTEWRYFDNGGKTFDRYSVWLGLLLPNNPKSGFWLGIGDTGNVPNGFCQHGEGLAPADLGQDFLVTEIDYCDLPPAVQRAVCQEAAMTAELLGDAA